MRKLHINKNVLHFFFDTTGAKKKFTKRNAVSWKAEQDNEILRVGDKWVETDRLFTKWNGEPMNNQTPYGWLSEFCEKNNLPFYGLHTFRHLFASMLVNEGVDIVTVSGALGHSAVSTTSNIYCHLMDNAQARVPQAITNALGLSDGDTN